MKSFVENPTFFLLSLCSAWMVGIGLRFLVDGWFNHRTYNVNGFDVFFDWGILIILGVILFVYGVYQALKQDKEAST